MFLSNFYRTIRYQSLSDQIQILLLMIKQRCSSSTETPGFQVKLQVYEHGLGGGKKNTSISWVGPLESPYIWISDWLPGSHQNHNQHAASIILESTIVSQNISQNLKRVLSLIKQESYTNMQVQDYQKALFYEI